MTQETYQMLDIVIKGCCAVSVTTLAVACVALVIVIWNER